jgi:hypothetical protein
MWTLPAIPVAGFFYSFFHSFGRMKIFTGSGCINHLLQTAESRLRIALPDYGGSGAADVP